MGLIQVRAPYGSPLFPEEERNRQLFDRKSDPADEWQASYYRSLHDADGVVLIGGGYTTFITGHLAVGLRKAVLPVACFGGAALKIWQSLKPERDLVTEAARDQMATSGWRQEYAKEMVSGLLAQHQKRQQELKEQREMFQQQGLRLNIRAGLVVALSAIALGMAAWSGALTRPAAGIAQGGVAAQLPEFLLYLIGPVAGAAGAITRTLWKPSESSASIAITFAKGFMAGGTATVIYLLAQLATVADVSQIRSVSMLIALAVGLLAGFTFDRVFARMADADVPIDLPAPDRGPGAARLAPRLRPGKKR
jgi:hypothetical protein